MARKRAIWWLADAIRLDAEGRTSREIADVLRKRAKPGQKVPGQSTIFTKLKALKALKAGAAPPPAPAAAPEVVLEPPAPVQPVPLDASPIPPEGQAGILFGVLRILQARTESAVAENDPGAIDRAIRGITTVANALQKQQAKERDDGEIVKVRATDMTAAAERARAKVHDLIARLIEEQSRIAEGSQ